MVDSDDKPKFGASVRSKNPTAQVNEVLCKALDMILEWVQEDRKRQGLPPLT